MHEKTVHKNIVHKCQKCNVEFKYSSGLSIHNSKFHNTGEKLLECETCKKNYPDEFSLKNHITNYHKNYNCKNCQQIFASKFTYETHVKRVHQNVKYLCHLCGKDMINQQSLTYHLTNVHSKVKQSKKVKQEKI